MRIAHDPQGEPIEASAQAPLEAKCPFCGGSVTLRSRKAMGSRELTHFWRHVRLTDFDCPGRSSPNRQHIPAETVSQFM